MARRRTSRNIPVGMCVTLTPRGIPTRIPVLAALAKLQTSSHSVSSCFAGMPANHNQPRLSTLAGYRWGYHSQRTRRPRAGCPEAANPRIEGIRTANEARRDGSGKCAPQPFAGSWTLATGSRKPTFRTNPPAFARNGRAPVPLHGGHFTTSLLCTNCPPIAFRTVVRCRISSNTPRRIALRFARARREADRPKPIRDPAGVSSVPADSATSSRISASTMASFLGPRCGMTSHRPAVPLCRSPSSIMRAVAVEGLAGSPCLAGP